jgi:hypothetical protein
MKQRILQILAVAIIMSMPILSQAQPGFGDDVDDVPVDGGISLLVAAGIGYGAKKIRDSRKKK